MSLIRDFNLFPETDGILLLERKYGDSLNYEDLYGIPKKPKKKKIFEYKFHGDYMKPFLSYYDIQGMSPPLVEK